MKSWNVYSIERRKGRMVTKFIGQIESEARKLKRAAREVSKHAGVSSNFAMLQPTIGGAPIRDDHSQVPCALAG